MGIEHGSEQRYEKNIGVLGKQTPRDVDNLKFCALTDGNNRGAKELNKGYMAGGDKVRELAEYFARRGDVRTFIACIMSQDNVTKRSEDFFWKIYQAFAGLGISMEADNTLIKDDIRLEIYGDIEGLKERGDAALQL